MEWISVNDRFPSGDGIVWACNSRYSDECYMAYYSSLKSCFFLAVDKDTLGTDCRHSTIPIAITHWIDLPKCSMYKSPFASKE